MTRHANISYPRPTIKAALGGGLPTFCGTARFLELAGFLPLFAVVQPTHPNFALRPESAATGRGDGLRKQAGGCAGTNSFIRGGPGMEVSGSSRPTTCR